jgi:hypothetical protein
MALESVNELPSLFFKMAQFWNRFRILYVNNRPNYVGDISLVVKTLYLHALVFAFWILVIFYGISYIFYFFASTRAGFYFVNTTYTAYHIPGFGFCLSSFFSIIINFFQFFLVKRK